VSWARRYFSYGGFLDGCCGTFFLCWRSFDSSFEKPCLCSTEEAAGRGGWLIGDIFCLVGHAQLE